MEKDTVRVQLTEKGIETYRKYAFMMCKIYEKTKFYKSMFIYYYNFLDQVNRVFTGTLEDIYKIFGADLSGNIVDFQFNEEVAFVR